MVHYDINDKETPMGVISTWTLTARDLEEMYDGVKALVVRQLVIDKLIDPHEADDWCEAHTIIIRNKGFFRTISDKWFKRKSNDNEVTMIVKLCPPVDGAPTEDEEEEKSDE
jgi:hypothetical protein